MKKVLTIIVASVLNIQNTSLMANDACEIGGDDNTVPTTSLTTVLENPHTCYGIFSYLPLKESESNRAVSKEWNTFMTDFLQRSAMHLRPRATQEDIKDFLKSPEFKIPFYYAPKNARRNMNDFFLKPDSWEMMAKSNTCNNWYPLFPFFSTDFYAELRAELFSCYNSC